MAKQKKQSKNPYWKGYGKISGKIFSEIKYKAKKRKIVFNVTIEYLWQIFEKQAGKCALSGVKLCFPSNSCSTGRRNGNASLDRIDSKIGYIEGNLQWVDKDLNLMKRHHKEDKFIKLCKKVANNN